MLAHARGEKSGNEFYDIACKLSAHDRGLLSKARARMSKFEVVFPCDNLLKTAQGLREEAYRAGAAGHSAAMRTWSDPYPRFAWLRR